MHYLELSSNNYDQLNLSSTKTDEDPFLVNYNESYFPNSWEIDIDFEIPDYILDEYFETKIPSLDTVKNIIQNNIENTSNKIIQEIIDLINNDALDYDNHIMYHVQNDFVKKYVKNKFTEAGYCVYIDPILDSLLIKLDMEGNRNMNDFDKIPSASYLRNKLDKKYNMEVDKYVKQLVEKLESPDNLGNNIIEVYASDSTIINNLVIKKFKDHGYYIDVNLTPTFQRVFSINLWWQNV